MKRCEELKSNACWFIGRFLYTQTIIHPSFSFQYSITFSGEMIEIEEQRKKVCIITVYGIYCNNRISAQRTLYGFIYFSSACFFFLLFFVNVKTIVPAGKSVDGIFIPAAVVILFPSLFIYQSR